MSRKPEVLLENWCQHGTRLYGQFFRHAVIKDWRYAHTSDVLQLEYKDGTGFAETQNTIYTLGTYRKAGCQEHWCLMRAFNRGWPTQTLSLEYPRRSRRQLRRL